MDIIDELTLCNDSQPAGWFPGGFIPLVRTEAGVAIFLMPDAGELARLNAGQPIVINLPEGTVPRMEATVLTDVVTDPQRGVPDSFGWKPVALVGGPLDATDSVAALGRAKVYNPAPAPGADAYECYAAIPGDPAHTLRHAGSYILENTPGADYIEQAANIEAERAEVSAWFTMTGQDAARLIVPPQLADLATPPDRAHLHAALLFQGFEVPSVGP
jgi:hypothetical protein